MSGLINASEKGVDGIYTLTVPATLMFGNLFEPRRYKDPRTGKESGEPKYDAMLVFDLASPDVKGMKDLAGTIAKVSFPGKAFADLQFPFKSGDKIIAEAIASAEKKGKKAPDNDALAGKLTVTARSQYAPRLSVLQNGKVTDYKDESRLTVKDKFYNGVQVLAELNFFPHEVGSNKPGVTAYLNAVLSLNKGERIGGGRSGQETFGSYVGKLSATDPTEGMATADDEIPY